MIRTDFKKTVISNNGKKQKKMQKKVLFLHTSKAFVQ